MGVRILEGTVQVSVTRRIAAVRILVSHGAIEVLGTRFTIVQEKDHGSVTLEEGEIRFEDHSGGLRALAPGERLEWPVVARAEPPAEPGVAKAVSKTRRAPQPTVAAPIVFRDADDLFEQVEVLRSRGEYAEAARYLTHGLTTDLRPDTRERLSYELGAILTWRLLAAPRACAHWRDHTRRYPGGRYQLEVVQAQKHAHCEEAAR